jgi:hypothetical protein
MARRSPTNARYQRNTEPPGKTRRSASAAKPKREAGTQTESAGKPAVKKAPRQTFREAWRDAPTSPEVKYWQRIWWATMGTAIAVLALTLVFPIFKTDNRLGIGALVVYAAFLGLALYIQMTKVKPAREKAAAEAKAAKKKNGKA